MAAEYTIAAFGADGELVGTAGASRGELSPKWLDFAAQLIAANPAGYKGALPLKPLKHIELRVTTTNGASLVSLSVRGQAATSALALTGVEPETEADLIGLFVDSLRRVPFVHQAAAHPSPFEGIFRLRERPLYVVVPWANPKVRDADQELVQEFERHLAGALLGGPVAE